MGTAAKLVFLVLALAFFMGCGGVGTAAGNAGMGVQYYSATCYSSDSTQSTYWCTNPPKVTIPSPTPSPSPGTTQ